MFYSLDVDFYQLLVEVIGRMILVTTGQRFMSIVDYAYVEGLIASSRA